MTDIEQARELLAQCLDEWGHSCEAENVRAGEDLESYESELRLLGQLQMFGIIAPIPTLATVKPPRDLRTQLHPAPEESTNG